MSELETIPTLDSDRYKFDFTSKINDEVHLSKTKDEYLSNKSNIISNSSKKHCTCSHCPNVIFKNIYDRKHMLKFIKEKEEAFEGSELENETIENE